MSQQYVPVELRRFVRDRAGERCEYCLIPQAFTLLSHEIDHVVAEKHGGETVEANLALACALCNKHKGTDLTSIDPLTGAIQPLFHPRQHRWQDHFELADGWIRPLSATGRVTVTLLQLNLPELVAERQLLVRSGNLRVG
jgi:hypothetical protein